VYKTVPVNTPKDKGVAEGSEEKYLWHGSRQKIPMLEPRQSVDTGGAAGSNQNAIYATSDPKVAIAVGGLTTPDSDTAMFPNDPQMVLFSGKIRKGENVYLHKLSFYGPDGKPQFVQGAHDREFYSIPGVKGIKPTEIKAVPVDKYLNLIRKATPADLELRKKNMKQQGVAEEQHSCPHCGGEMVSEELMNEKKDACYYKVKSRYKVWPSAYASGALVKCRKSGADSWGNGGKKNESSILEGINRADESLHDWFNKEKWVRMDTKGNIKGPCAKEPGEGKPKCLPQSKAHGLGKKGRASAAQRKRREDPNPDRSGKAINVDTTKSKG
jgi:ssDNA-binding Zn-finger/Zn-ribbon topoisomerase 1